jgi:16S rRNA (uracil1498-N3)-methyltransferase
MARRRFYWDLKLSPRLPKSGEKILLSPEESRHAARVVRMRRGDRFILMCELGEAEAEVRELPTRRKDKRLVAMFLEDMTPAGYVRNKKESARAELKAPFPVVAISLLKKADAFETALQKSAELGVKTFVPIISERTQSRFPGKEKLTRWNRIVRETNKLTGRSLSMVLAPPSRLIFFLDSLTYLRDRNTKTFTDSLTDLQDSFRQARRVKEIHEHGARRHIRDTDYAKSFYLMDQLGEKPRLPLKKDSVFLIGPEGGFSLEEKALIRTFGFSGLSFGDTTLRAETAAITAATMIMASRFV